HLYSDCYLNGSMTCVDCHDPHSLHYRDVNGTELVGKFDDRQCTSCHASKAENLTAHTFHKPDSAGSRCTSCHMPFLRHPPIGPALGFERSDHSIAIPRPAYDAGLGLDNACSQCHRDMTVAQLEEQVRAWYGPLKPHKPVVQGLSQAAGPPDAEQAAKTLLRSGIPMAEVVAISQFIQSFVQPDVLPSKETLDRFRGYAQSSDLDVQAMGMTALHLVKGADPTLAGELDRMSHPAVESRRRVAMRLLADAWLEEGRASRSSVAYRKALELDPDYALAHLGLARSMIATKRFNAALPHLRKAGELAPYHTSIQNNVGAFLAQGGQLEEAVEHFRRVAEANRDDPEFLNNYARALNELGQTEKAVETFQEVLKHDPRHANARIVLGLLFEQQGRLEEALAHFLEAERAHLNNVFVLMRLVEIHQKSRRAPETYRLLKRSEQLAFKKFGGDDARTLDIRKRIQWLESMMGISR
ncbi:MAG: tetratricopeptide repeat protein, partial [Verrucomicrobiota bacterium]